MTTRLSAIAFTGRQWVFDDIDRCLEERER